MKRFSAFLPSLLWMLPACRSEAESSARRTSALTTLDNPCGVQLSMLNAENPGADTAELLELSLTTPEPDSGLATFLDCGIHRLVLLDPSCSERTSIELGSTRLPADGHVLLCARDSRWEAECDLGTSRDAPLENGWLVQGAGYGLSLVGPNGPVLTYAYEETNPRCRDALATILPLERGSAPGGGDDVILECNGTYRVTTLEAAAPDASDRCDDGSVPAPPGLVSTDVDASAVVSSEPSLGSTGMAGASSSGVRGDEADVDGAPLGRVTLIGDVTQEVPSVAALPDGVHDAGPPASPEVLPPQSWAGPGCSTASAAPGATPLGLTLAALLARVFRRPVSRRFPARSARRARWRCDSSERLPRR